MPRGRRLVPWEPELGDQATAVARRAGATRPTLMKHLDGKLAPDTDDFRVMRAQIEALSPRDP